MSEEQQEEEQSEQQSADEKKNYTKEQKEGFFMLLQDVRDQLGTMETTVYRRLDEVSAEVNATCQMVGMSEDSLKGNFSEILETLNAVSFSGDTSTAANTGVELDAVITATDEAANTILDAADKLTAMLQEEEDISTDNLERVQKLGKMQDLVQEIVMACSFQDITGQRIQKTLENIESAETKLVESLEKIGIKTPEKKEKQDEETVPEQAQQDLSTQDEIDALFG